VDPSEASDDHGSATAVKEADQWPARIRPDTIGPVLRYPHRRKPAKSAQVSRSTSFAASSMRRQRTKSGGMQRLLLPRLARPRVTPRVSLIDTATVPVEADVAERDTGRQRQIRSACLYLGVVTVAKYLVLFSLTGETIKRFLDKPSDRAAVVRDLAESVGGSLESYYWMFGQYDGAAVFVLPDSHTMAALSLAATSSGAFTRFETHELIDANDLLAIADRAKGIAYQPPGG
jgi:uncharacterized protein with GYD domain